MLVLSRKPGEKVIIGDAITLTVVALSRNTVRIGIDAPAHIRILRDEIAGGRPELRGSNHRHPELVTAVH
jgi:carbon storage regulator